MVRVTDRVRNYLKCVEAAKNRNQTKFLAAVKIAAPTNLYMLSALAQHYRLDESVSNFIVSGVLFSFYFQ